MTNYPLNSTDELTLCAKEIGCSTWRQLCGFVANLPYERISDASNRKYVLIEKRGTCSSKHALLKTMADLNNIPDVELFIGMYRMNTENTPLIGNTLKNSGLDYIPEAHCYLKVSENYEDYTSTSANIDSIRKDLLKEYRIEPNQIGEHKTTLHQQYIKEWIKNEQISLGFEEVWFIREQCIKAMSKNNMAEKL